MSQPTLPTPTTEPPIVTPPYPPLYTPFKFLSLRLAVRLTPTRLSSNALTVVWALLLITASVALAYEHTVYALALILLSILLDCLDGDLARHRRKPSLAGTLLEQLAHWTGNMGLVAGVAAGLLLDDPQPGNILLAAALVVVQAVYIAVVRQVRPDAASVAGYPRLRAAFRCIVKGIYNLSPIELPMAVALVVSGVTQEALIALTGLFAVLSGLVFVPHFVLVRAADRSQWGPAAPACPGAFTNLPAQHRTAVAQVIPDARWWTPGVPRLPAEVQALLGRQAPASGAPVLEAVWRDVTAKLPELFRTKGAVLPFSGPDDLAWEAVLRTLCAPGDAILIVGGRTSVERRRKAADRFGVRVSSLLTPFGAGAPPTKLDRLLADHPAVRLVLLSQTEAEDGTRTDLAAVAEVLRAHDALFAVDACLGLCADDLRMDEWGVDIALSSSDSGMMAPPGVSLVALGPRALRLLDEPAADGGCAGTSLDLRTHREAESSGRRLAAPALAGLQMSVGLILEAGLDHVLAHHQRLAERFRRGCVDVAGLELASTRPSAACTTALLPAAVDVRELQNQMFATARMVVATGADPQGAPTLHFGHVGWLADDDVDLAVRTLAAALDAARDLVPTHVD
ncbi:aminotransferase class V-fold PLP-dependent enzyme [Streptomyces mirabilis]|uniref:aminotransferase class V-fold PLP-dependent enzyme n=1 Tax=Streptomyces mirabilis TaxID=68239 RepID=UPI0036A3B921